MKTPTANLGTNGGSQHPDVRKATEHGPTLADEVEHLLPTPRAQNGMPRNQRPWLRPLEQPQNLENAIARFPTVSDTGHQPLTDGHVYWEEPHLIPPHPTDE